MIQKRILEIKYSSQLQPLGSPNTRLTSNSMAELVVFLPSNPGNLTYTWITPGNVKVGERALFRDSARDKDGMYAFSALIYPNMTSGVLGDIGQAIVIIRTGNLTSGIVRITVEKSIVPETSEMPKTLAQDVLDRLNILDDEKADKDDVDLIKQKDIEQDSELRAIESEVALIQQKDVEQDSELRAIENEITRLDIKDAEQDAKISELETDILENENNIKDGTTIVKKAEQDANGNNITNTYETKADATNKLATKVDKTQKIIGIDLQDDILLTEFKTALGNATQSVAGLLSAEDKTHLDGLVALLENSDGNNVVDTIGEILAIFQNYPEGADLVTVLQGKVDKVAGKGLSTNDLTDILKDNYDVAYAHSQIDGANPHQTTYAQLLNKPTTIEQSGILNVYNKEYIDTLKDKNGWESELLGTLENNETIPLSIINQYDEIQMYAKDTSGVIDNENIRPSLMQSGDSVYFFDDTQAFITVDTDFGFYAPVGYTLQVVGIKYTELKAIDTIYDNTESEMNATTVQGAIDELDSKFDDKVDNVDLERANKRVNELERELREIGSDSEVINKNGYEIDLGANAIGNVKVDMLAGGKNLASPDLTGKEYLGDGWYQLYKSGDRDYRYNIYLGYWYLDGLNITTGIGLGLFNFNLEVDNQYTAFINHISGLVSRSDIAGVIGRPSIDASNNVPISWIEQSNGYFYQHSVIVNDKFVFKLQIEKGSTATDYEVPYINATTLKRLSIQNSTINEAMPDLTGKLYLGNGIYRIVDNDRVTFDYNVYNGVWTFNTKIPISQFSDYFLPITLLDINVNYYFDTINLTPHENLHILFRSTGVPDYVIVNRGLFNIDTRVGGGFRINSGVLPEPISIVNYQFKIQIEKGTTATPYVPPIFNENNVHSELFIKPKIQLQANDIITYNKGNFLLNDTILNTSGLLVAQPNTKLVIENITNEVNTYGSELLYNIVSIKKLLKINQDGTETPIDLSTITINDNTFTTPQLYNNDLFYIVYEFETIESPLKAFASYYNSDKIVIDETTDKVYKWKVKINNGVPELIATEVE